MDDSMELPHPASVRLKTSYRRRRVIWVGVLTTILVVVFFAPSSFWGSSSMMQEYEKSSPESNLIAPHSNEKHVGETYKGLPILKDIELKNLLHMVVSSERTIPPDADPTEPLALNAYAGEMEASEWLTELESDPPLIVFSKTYCPYSKKAKDLLVSLDISPPPKVIEVDLRSDADAIKSLLTRLTDHSTFPNVILSAKSLGGYDSLQVMHDEGRLVRMLEEKGLTVEGASS